MSQSKPQNPSRDHHILPQFYLKGFALTKGSPFIWVYRRGRLYLPGKEPTRFNPTRTPIKKAAMIRDFYAAISDNGTVEYEKFEALLQKREDEGAKLLKRLCQGQRFGASEKRQFASFIILMHQRSPARQLEVPKLWEKTFVERVQRKGEGLQRDIALEYEEARGRKLTESEIEAIDVLCKSKKEIPDEIRLDSMFYEMPLALNALSAMSWSVLIAPVDKFFVTSDNTVAIKNGLTYSNSEVLFPLCSNMVLLIKHSSYSDVRFEHIDSAAVESIKQSICDLATSEVYAPKEDGALVKAMNSSFPSRLYL